MKSKRAHNDQSELVDCRGIESKYIVTPIELHTPVDVYVQNWYEYWENDLEDSVASYNNNIEY